MKLQMMGYFRRSPIWRERLAHLLVLMFFWLFPHRPTSAGLRRSAARWGASLLLAAPRASFWAA